MKHKFGYEEAIDKLNKLTSNVTVIKQATQNKTRQKEIKRDSTLRYLEYTGFNRSQLKKLSVIHIAGTKGKGSTSSMCESILRNHGYKTGFFSSPHLVSVTERIKINGLSLEEDYFAEVFSRVYQKIYDNRQNETDMPPYFGFLTVMALHIFITKQVDVAIIEVGIGGKYDQTNVVSNVPVAGITSLGYDHTNLLGNTIEEIAQQKAGIMKRGSKVYTVDQPIEAMKVLIKTATKKKCFLNVVPDYESYNWLDTNHENNMKLNNPTKHLNASLAIQLAHNWMTYKEIYEKNTLNNTIDKNNIVEDLPLKTFVGLQSSFWPGRCQILALEDEDYYLDGAHTVESTSVCSQWFKHHSRKSSLKVLIFHITGDRNPEPMLKLLLECEFDMVLFVPNIAYDEKEIKNSIDQVCTNVEENQQMETCNRNAAIWKKLITAYKPNKVISNINVFTNMSSAFNHVSSYYKTNNEFERPQILVTGSLLLVGTALTVLDPLLIKSK